MFHRTQKTKGGERHKKQTENSYSQESESDSLSPPLSVIATNELQEEIHLNKLHLHNLRIPSNVLIIGPRRSGKTTLNKRIVELVDTQISAKGCIITSDIENYEVLNLDDVWDLKSIYDFPENSLDEYSIRVIEDVNPKDKYLFDLFKHKRALNIIAIDNYVHLSSTIRHTIDYVILLKHIRNLRDVWFDLAGLVDNYTEFETIYENCTTNNCFLIIDNFGKSKRIETHLKWGELKGSDSNINDEDSSDQSIENGYESESDIENNNNTTNNTKVHDISADVHRTLVINEPKNIPEIKVESNTQNEKQYSVKNVDLHPNRAQLSHINDKNKELNNKVEPDNKDLVNGNNPNNKELMNENTESQIRGEEEDECIIL